MDLCSAPCARVGIHCGAAPGLQGVHTQHKRIGVLCSRPFSLLQGHYKVSKVFPSQTRSPPTSQGASRVWPLLWIRSNLKIGHGLQMKFDVQTAKNLGDLWYPVPHLDPICTKDSCHFPGLKQSPDSGSPETWTPEICSWIFQHGSPSSGNISCSHSPVPIFQMLSMFSASASQDWR